MIDCFIKQSSFSISNCMESHTVKIPIVDLFIYTIKMNLKTIC